MNSLGVRLSTDEKINFFGNLSTMLSSSISLLDSVNTLLEESKGNLKFFLTTLRDDIVAGKRINTTFAKFPKSYNKVIVNLVRAAEEGGTLETTLMDIKNNIQKESEFTDKVRSALMYPVIISTILVGVLLMILIVVIPKIAVVFTRLRVELPMATKVLIAVSSFLLTKYVYVIFGLVVILVIGVFLYKEKRQFFVNVLVSLPLINTISKKIDLTNFARSLYLLLSSGLPISSALELSNEVVNSKQIREIIDKSRKMLVSGKQLSGGLKQYKKKVIPVIMVRLIEVGEKSGTLDKSMRDISSYLDYEVSKDLKTMTALIEPIMLIFVSVAVGVMMISIIGPIYGMISQVGGGMR